jgi:hypothetical protein
MALYEDGGNALYLTLASTCLVAAGSSSIEANIDLQCTNFKVRMGFSTAARGVQPVR